MSEAVDWAELRRQWCEDDRKGYAWLARESGVTANALRNKALAEGWAKDSDVQAVLYGPAAKDGYRAGFATAAAKLALLGMDRCHIAAMFKVSNEQLGQWVETHPQLKTAIEDGGRLAEAALVEQLHKCATGYSYETEQGLIHVPADPESLLFLLSNPQNFSRER